ncbi:MAG: CPBP family glutamic-type intramembrane protease [Bryobacteraceae bacterium]|nr:CPBP family glutamic-type intramembrane protease [Bryobacteraceae bacterium]
MEDAARERLTAGDRRLTLLAVLLAFAAAAYTWLNYSAAFPQASIDLRLTREQITERASAFLASRGLKPDGFRNLTVFDPDENAQIYLEREAGLEQANSLMRDQVSVWRWRARWFKPPEKEERIVLLSPAGQLVGFDHIVPETLPGARLPQEQAAEIARTFLTSRTQDPHRLIDQQRTERPNRVDYTFTFEKEGFKVKDATYRRTVTVHGDQIGSYREYLHVPEQWQRDFAALRSRNELYAGLATSLYAPLILAALVILIVFLRRSNLDWRPALIASAVVGGLMVLNQWNLLPLAIDRMPTSTSFPEMLTLLVLQALGGGVLTFLYVVLAGAAGEPLYRLHFPGKLSLRQALSRKGLQTREFFLASVTGSSFAALHMAFVVAFYLIGRKLGAWSPQDVGYSDLLSTWFPWLYPLTISVLASTSEEFWFRLFAIPLLLRFVKLRWLAIIIPAFVWGFLHANYPQQPAWIRGVEVGLIGVAAGWLMLRFGILATLIWHYTVDAIFIGSFLFQSSNLYFQLSGLFVAGIVALPLGISLVSYARRGGFLKPEEAVPPPEEEPPAQPAEPAPPPSAPADFSLWPARWLYIAAAIALAAGLLVGVHQFGDFVEVRLTRQQAEEVAAREARAQGLDPAQWRTVSDFLPNLRIPEFEYLRRQTNAADAARHYREHTLTGLWRTRYFQPGQKHEWVFAINSAGRVVRVDRVLDEKAPGPQLSQLEARARAEQDLNQRGYAIDRYRLVDAQTEKKDNRTDHSFTWEASNFAVAEARARVSLQVQGDKPSAFRPFLKIPDEWLREFQKPRLSAILFPAAIGVVAFPLLIVFLRRLAGRGDPPHRFHWRAYGGLAAAAVLLAALDVLNSWPSLFAGYNTEVPLANFTISLAVGRVMLVLFSGVMIFLGAMALDVFVQLALRGAPQPPVQPLHIAAIVALSWGASRVLAAVGQWVPGPRFGWPVWSASGLEAILPAFSILEGSFQAALIRLFTAGIAVAALIRFVPPARRLILVAALLVLLAAGQPTIPLALWAVASAAANLALAYLALRTTGPSVATYAAAFFLLAAAGAAAPLMDQPAPWYRLNALAAVVIAAAVAWVYSKYFSPRARYS